MAERRNANVVVATLGLILIGSGLLFLFAQTLGFNLFGHVWPLFILTPGLLCFAGLVAGGRRSAGLAVPGALLMTVGGMLTVQSLTGYYESWAYAWALLPAAVGVGIAVVGLMHRNRTTLLVGAGLAAVNVAIFLFGGAVYELLPRLDRQFGHLSGWRYLDRVLGMLWPAWIMLVGAILACVMLIGGKSAAPMVVPVSIVTGVGMLLLYQSLFDAYGSWAYAWALIPVMVGAGLVANGLWVGKRELVQAGKGLAIAGLLLFAVLGTFFELVLNLSGGRGGMLTGVVWSVLLIVAGGILLLRQLLHRPERV